ncbi:tyrosine--tRNA ligase, partial [archaeon]
DQRKIHVLAREVYPKLKWEKPVALHHHLLAGLSEPPQAADKLEKTIAAKMSKSKPWTAIFIHDTDKEIKEKLNKAWCPEKQVELNPVLEILKYIVFREIDTLIIDRPQKFGGRVEFNSYDELESAYAKGAIHPLDLKKTTTEELSKVLKPIREHFAKKPELLEVYKTIEITR